MSVMQVMISVEEPRCWQSFQASVSITSLTVCPLISQYITVDLIPTVQDVSDGAGAQLRDGGLESPHPEVIYLTREGGWGVVIIKGIGPQIPNYVLVLAIAWCVLIL